jgi:hypothetical protein
MVEMVELVLNGFVMGFKWLKIGVEIDALYIFLMGFNG